MVLMRSSLTSAGALLAVMSLQTMALEEVLIEQFESNGTLIFNTVSNAVGYRIEWAPTPTATWTNFQAAATALDNIPGDVTGSVTASVPMFYRVVATVSNPPPPCTIASSLSCSSNASGSTVGQLSLLDGYLCTPGIPQPGSELIYEFTAPNDGEVTVTLSSMTSDHDLYILEGTCSTDSCISSGNDSGTSGESASFSAVQGIDYFIVVESTGGEGSFELSFDGCPEDCDDGLDNDLDGQTDCDDPDCSSDPACPPEISGNSTQPGSKRKRRSK